VPTTVRQSSNRPSTPCSLCPPPVFIVPILTPPPGATAWGSLHLFVEYLVTDFFLCPNGGVSFPCDETNPTLDRGPPVLYSDTFFDWNRRRRVSPPYAVLVTAISFCGGSVTDHAPASILRDQIRRIGFFSTFPTCFPPLPPTTFELHQRRRSPAILNKTPSFPT